MANVVPSEIQRIGHEEIHITWADGSKSVLANRALRLECPCAGCVDELSGKKTLDPSTVPDEIWPSTIELVGHYAIGIVLGVLYVAGAGWLSVSPGVLLVALGYGLATCVFPWFLMFPAFGFGLLGRRGPQELRLFRTSLINHLFYGFGLWWIAEVLRLG